MSTSVELKHLAVAVASVLPVIFRVLPQGVFGRHMKFWRSPALLAEPLTAPLEGSEDSKLLGQAHFLHSQLCLCPRGPKLWRWVPGSPEIRDEQKKWLTRLDLRTGGSTGGSYISSITPPGKSMKLLHVR